MHENLIKDLNNLNSENPLLVLLEIFIPDTAPVRLVNNSENFTFKGQEYIALNFELGELIAEKGTLPTLSLRIDNTSRALAGVIEQYDYYLKKNGVSNGIISANIYIVNAIDSENAILDESFELNEFSVDAEFVNFTFGTHSLFSIAYPPRKIYKNFCCFAFKDSGCGYTGSARVCDKSFKRCKELKNSHRFGGFIGVKGGIKE